MEEEIVGEECPKECPFLEFLKNGDCYGAWSECPHKDEDYPDCLADGVEELLREEDMIEYRDSCTGRVLAFKIKKKSESK